MKTKIINAVNPIYVILSFLALLLANCSPEDNPLGKQSEWTYDTGENPYGSKPFISGDRLILCSRNEDVDEGTIHCVNRSDGRGVWTMTDSTVTRNNALVYNDLVIYGGYNAHALRLADGSHAWNFQDEMIHFMLFSSPVRSAGDVYLGANMGFFKLDAMQGALIWKNSENLYQNLSMAGPCFKDDKVYYATMTGNVYAFDVASGSIDWTLDLPAGFANTPLVANGLIYLGIQEGNSSNNSLFCYRLDDRSPVWQAKIWQVVSNMAIDGDRLFAVGGSTLYCLSAATGTEQWRYEMEAGSVGEPLVHLGKVYVGNGDHLACLDEATGKVVWRYEASGRKGFGPPVALDNRLYVACSDGKLYCFSL